MIVERPAAGARPAPAWRAARALVRASPTIRDDAIPAANGLLLSRTEIGARLLGSFDAAREHPSEVTAAALRAVVTSFVDRMKALDLPLDRVIAAIETMLREHHVPEPLPTLDLDAPSTHDDGSMRRRLLEWCVRAYDDDAWW